ncbi:MAG TPA: hypothetical protein VM554_12790 [Acidisarcina sp.]|nr:hypothetical protein [Acidisarcina sp.]
MSNDEKRESTTLHPFIEGLLKTLPQPETAWGIDDRTKWIRAAASIFDVIYSADDEVFMRVADGDRSSNVPWDQQPCPGCQAPLNDRDLRCPHCGARNTCSPF